MSDAGYRGRFVWHELMTLDVSAGISFYAKVVGWKAQNWDVDPSYRLLVGKSGPVAGVMVLPAEAKAMGAPPHWLTYIGTPDVDATARQAKELGATILKAPDDIPNGGRFAIIQDPQGAVFAIYRAAPGSPPPADSAAVPGEFSWHELVTTDPEAAFEFYRQLFGWEKTSAMDMGEMGTYQMYGWGGVPKGGVYVKPANMPAPPHWMPYAMVPDAKKAAVAIGASRGMVLHGPAEVPGGDWITMGRDPQGVAFAVHSLAATTAKSAPARPARSGAKQASAKPVKKPAKQAAAKPAKKAAKKAVKKAARKAPRKSAKKPARKAARKSAKKAAGRKRVAKKPVRRAKRAAGKRAGRGKRR